MKFVFETWFVSPVNWVNVFLWNVKYDYLLIIDSSDDELIELFLTDALLKKSK